MVWKSRSIVDEHSIAVEEVANQHTPARRYKHGRLLRRENMRPGEI